VHVADIAKRSVKSWNRSNQCWLVCW